MSQPMTFQEAGDLLKHIRDFHSPFSAHRTRKVVKYADPHFDMRTGHCFAIKLRGYGWEETFHTQNECRNLPKSVYERGIEFLNKDTP